MKYTKITLIIFMAGVLISAKTNSPEWVTKLHKAYTDDPQEFVDYWLDSEAMENYECVYNIPQELIISKMWLETHGGHTGVGRYGCLFGIKGKGIRGYDAKEAGMTNKGKVEYRAYGAAWEAISDFCKLISKPLYADRFDRWQEKNYDMPDWYNYNLALQVDPERGKSRLSYASCGCEGSKKISVSCYSKRKRHAVKNINWILNNLR